MSFRPSLKYVVHVETTNARIATDFYEHLGSASAQYDKISEQYPYHKVLLLEITTKELKVREAKKREPPQHRHSDRILGMNKESAVQPAGEGRWFCRICGEVWTDEGVEWK